METIIYHYTCTNYRFLHIQVKGEITCACTCMRECKGFCFESFLCFLY